MQETSIKIRPFPVVRSFLIVYLILNGIGLLNLPLYVKYLDPKGAFLVFLLGLLGFLLGVFIFRGLSLKFKKTVPNFKKTKIIKISFLFFNIITLGIIFYTNFRNGGIILLSEDDRFQSFALTNLFVYTTILITLTYYANKQLQNKKIVLKDILFLGLLSVMFMTLGYRTPLIILLGGFFVVFYSIRNDHQNKLKKIFSWKILVAILTFLILMSSIASFRVSRKYNVDKYYRNINSRVLNENPYLKPFVPAIALFRYNQEVVDKLIQKKTGKPMYMGLAMSELYTLLPGEQLGVRNIIGDIINAQKTPEGKPWSITPTLQGAMFVDGGYFFVFFGFFMTAIIMEILRKIILNQLNPFILVFYALMVITLLKCIHSGYIDASFIIVLVILYILKTLVYNFNYSIKINNS